MKKARSISPGASPAYSQSTGYTWSPAWSIGDGRARTTCRLSDTGSRPFTRAMAGAVDAEIRGLAAWLGLGLDLPG